MLAVDIYKCEVATIGVRQVDQNLSERQPTAWRRCRYHISAVEVTRSGDVKAEDTRVLLRDVMKLNLVSRNLRLFGPDATNLFMLFAQRDGRRLIKMTDRYQSQYLQQGITLRRLPACRSTMHGRALPYPHKQTLIDQIVAWDRKRNAQYTGSDHHHR